MTITKQEVINSFYTSGSNINVTYFRNLTKVISDIPIIISSSASNFYLRVYPTSSSGVSFRLSGSSTLVNKTSPITLFPKSGSNDTTAIIIATIDTTNFDQLVMSSKNFEIQFNLIAVTESYANTETQYSGSSTPPPTLLENGSACKTNIECLSGYCYNPENVMEGGICTNPPETTSNTGGSDNTVTTA